MAVTYMEVDTAQLSADIRELEQNAGKAGESLAAVKSEMDELNAMWKGSANAAFRAQVTKDCNLMADMLDHMALLADSMENAKTEYGKCENEVKDVVNHIRI